MPRPSATSKARCAGPCSAPPACGSCATTDMAAGASPRASERLALDAEITMRRLGKANYRVRVFNLSQHGCCVEFVERPRVGELMLMSFEGLGDLEAAV